MYHVHARILYEVLRSAFWLRCAHAIHGVIGVVEVFPCIIVSSVVHLEDMQVASAWSISHVHRCKCVVVRIDSGPRINVLAPFYL